MTDPKMASADCLDPQHGHAQRCPTCWMAAPSPDYPNERIVLLSDGRVAHYGIHADGREAFLGYLTTEEVDAVRARWKREAVN